MFLAWHYQNWWNYSTPQNKMATRAKNRKTFKQLLILNGWKDCVKILLKTHRGVAWWPSTKIAHTVPLNWTRWPPELKIEKPIKRLLLLNGWLILKISQKCLLCHCLPKLLKPSAPSYITDHFISTIWIRWAIQGHHGPLVLTYSEMNALQGKLFCHIHFCLPWQ